jgi:predicted DNA-binding transcriptional regulator AlpA
MTENYPDRLLTSRQVREILGGMSDMSLWRWLNSPTMEFPQPTYLARRRFWSEAKIAAWLSAQTKLTAA